MVHTIRNELLLTKPTEFKNIEEHSE